MTQTTLTKPTKVPKNPAPTHHHQDKAMTKHPEATPQNLYQITGNVTDMNTVLIERVELRRLQAECAELRTMQARIDQLEAAAHHAEYKMEGWLCKQYPLEACLYPESKDWVEGDYRDRVEWLHTMYEAVKSEVAQLETQLRAIRADSSQRTSKK